jgi:hypothetical protein
MPIIFANLVRLIPTNRHSSVLEFFQAEPAAISSPQVPTVHSTCQSTPLALTRPSTTSLTQVAILFKLKDSVRALSVYALLLAADCELVVHGVFTSRSHQLTDRVNVHALVNAGFNKRVKLLQIF